MVQDPTPPLPPLPPLPQVVVPGPGFPEELAVILVMAMLVAGVILFPLVRALARRLEGKGASPDVRAELDALHNRVAELEVVEQRLAELENRMEFSERLLTQQRVPESGGRQ
jgi:hypothetical protein